MHKFPDKQSGNTASKRDPHYGADRVALLEKYSESLKYA